MNPFDDMIKAAEAQYARHHEDALATLRRVSDAELMLRILLRELAEDLTEESQAYQRWVEMRRKAGTL